MHLYFLLKALIMIATVCCYVALSYYWNSYQIIAETYGLSTHHLWIQAGCQMIFFVLLLFGLDRRVRCSISQFSSLIFIQIEYMSRLDLLWTIKFQNEKHEVETVSTISRLLLENILPKHVAEIIIKENMSQVKRFNQRKKRKQIHRRFFLQGSLSWKLR